MEKLKAFRVIIKKYGLTKLFDFGLLFVYLNLAKNRLAKNSYGFVEAVFCPRVIDHWCRYADVIGKIEKLTRNRRRNRFSILECGGGGVGISRYLEPQKYSIFLVDVQKLSIYTSTTKDTQPIVGDATRLPFKNDSIDILISIGTVEHIPMNGRHNFFAELRRTCKNMVVLQFPVESKDGLFRAREYDIKFQEAHKRVFGFEDPSTAEHIDSIHPTIDEIKKAFPNSEIVGRKNCDIWLKYMMHYRKPLIGFLTGLIYHLTWAKEDNEPPFYECMMVWTKSNFG